MSLDIPDGEASISVVQLDEWRQAETPHFLLDVREAGELAICEIAGAVHIPMAQIPARQSELPSDLPLVVTCHHGGRSLRVVQFLRQAGLRNAINLDGGIDAWAVEIDPSVSRY